MAERRRDNVHSLQDDALRFLNSRAGQEARREIRDSLFEQWVYSSTVEQREKMHGLAVASEQFYRSLEKMARSGDIADFNEQVRREVV